MFFLASSAARARSFCTHQRSRITESSVFKEIHHKDRRQLQLSKRRWLHDCTASYVGGVSPSWSLRGGTRVSSGLGPGRRAQEAAQRQTQFLDHVLCLGNTITSRRYLPQCLRRARGCARGGHCPDTICSRHDLFKTRTVKTHFTMLVSVSHSMSISPVIEYVAPASAVTDTELSSDRVRGARTCRHPCSAFSSNRIRGTRTSYAAPATVIERSALQRISHEHEHI